MVDYGEHITKIQVKILSVLGKEKMPSPFMALW